ncbi:McrB family protein [Antrihabitans cavernicola]|nr:AAA family ATPase [Spelaeibacter cavernicola]
MSKTADVTIRVLRRFKNAILEGPPGTGKTFVVSEIAANWYDETGRELGGNGNGRYAITLHPSTTYEEFVEGLRYDDDNQGFSRQDGFLVNLVCEAKSNPDKDYLVLLDEINRANVPKVLGDVLLCMENTKRSYYDRVVAEWKGGVEVTLPYSGTIFSVPDNLFLLGTMNTSDRSIAPLDSALRRRFGFVRADPLGGNALHDAIKQTDGEDASDRMAQSVEELTNLNAALRDCLGPDATLGHSYLFGALATSGTKSSTPDPLEPLRNLANSVNAERVLWLEVATTSGGSGNQLDIPDEKGTRPGLRTEFYPMSSSGTQTLVPSPSGTQDFLDVHFHGVTLFENSLEYNSGGSNYRFKYKGRTATGEGIYDFTPRGSLEHKAHIFVRRPDYTYDLLLLDRDPTIITALLGVSNQPGGWTARTMPGASGRNYGVVDLDALAATGTVERDADEDAEWMIWRYAILPQLIDTVTQLGIPDLLDPTTRESALALLGKEDLAQRFESFDTFLRRLSLFVGIEGHGLSRGVVVSEVPTRELVTTGVDETSSVEVGDMALADEDTSEDPTQDD